MAKGRRGRRRPHAGPPPTRAAQRERAAKLSAPSVDYADEQGNVLTLRGSLTIGARREYAQALAGAGASAAATPQDIAERAFELLFERLAARWLIAGAPIERQRDLLARFRAASPQERAFVRGAIREHCEQHFPDVKAP